MLHTASQPQRILIAEHDPAICDLLQIFLQDEGYETERAASVEEAFGKVEEQLFHLVVMDPFALPNQPRLAEAARLKARCQPTPVGIITGWQIPFAEAERAGFAFLVRKPFSFEALIQRIANYLNHPFTPEQRQQALIIRGCLEALSMGDEETLSALCSPTLCYYPLTHSVFTQERGLIGIEAYLEYARLVRQRLSGLQIERMLIFPHSKGLMTRYRFCWQGDDGQRHALVNAAICRFQGERLSQMGVYQPVQRLQALLESPPEHTSA